MKIDDAIARYITLRDERDALKKEHADEIRNRFGDPMAKIEAAFLKHFNESGADSLKRKGVGTAYVTERVSDKVTDRDALIAYVEETKNFSLLDSRVSKRAVDEFIEENDDLPPGVHRSSEKRVNIRRG